jgi:hypothetical protein
MEQSYILPPQQHQQAVSAVRPHDRYVSDLVSHQRLVRLFAGSQFVITVNAPGFERGKLFAPIVLNRTAGPGSS